MMTSQQVVSGHTFYAIVPAAGVGKRMGADVPKQYLKIGDKTVLEWTLERLITHPQIDHIILPVSAEDTYISTLSCYSAKWLTVVCGGKERADSVMSGLESAPDCDWILVHDAARPCVSHHDISNLLTLADTGKDGGILACPVRDTMKRASEQQPNQIQYSEQREHLWHALTPQFFPKQQLHIALNDALKSGAQITDEASAIERQNGNVHLIEGLASNIKITRPEDLPLAEYYLTSGSTHDAFH